MKTASAKAKGRLLQNWVRDFLLHLHPSLEPDDIRSTGMGQGGEDIQFSPAARKVCPFSIECKSYASIAAMNWYDQAMINAPKGVEPVLVMKANRRRPVVVVDAEYFFNNIMRTRK